MPLKQSPTQPAPAPGDKLTIGLKSAYGFGSVAYGVIDVGLIIRFQVLSSAMMAAISAYKLYRRAHEANLRKLASRSVAT